MFRIPLWFRILTSLLGLVTAVLAFIEVPDQLSAVQRWLDRQGDERVRLAMVVGGLAIFLFFSLNEQIGRAFNRVTVRDSSLLDPPLWQLSITNHGKTRKFRVMADRLEGTGTVEEDWPMKWRLSGDRYHEVQNGETAAIDVAQAPTGVSALTRADRSVGIPVSFFTLSASAGTFPRKMWPGGAILGIAVFAEGGNGACKRQQFQMMIDETGNPVLVPHPGRWPRTTARLAGWRIEVSRWLVRHRPSFSTARLRVRLAERIARGSEQPEVVPVAGTMPPPNGELEVKMVDRDEAPDEESVAHPRPERAGAGIYHEVKWVGLKYPNGHVEADGPFCPRDDTRLKLTHRHDGDDPPTSEPNDYDIIGLGVKGDALFCETCQQRYYLDATRSDERRLGGARDQARRSLFRPLTALERSIRSLGL